MKRSSSYFHKMNAVLLTYRTKTAGSSLNASGSMIAMLLYERSLNNLKHVIIISNNALNTSTFLGAKEQIHVIKPEFLVSFFQHKMMRSFKNVL